MQNSGAIQKAIDNGYEFKIGNYISNGWELFKKYPGEYIGFTIVFLLIGFTLNFIPFFGFIGSLIVTPPLAVGWAIASHRAIKDGRMEFGNFFKGFDHIGQLIVAYLLTMIIMVVIALPLLFYFGLGLLQNLSSNNPDDIFSTFQQISKYWIWLLLFVAVLTYVSISIRWANLLIVFHKYDAVSAIKTSWQLVNKNWISHFLFWLLFILVIIAGIFALIVGVFVSYAVIMVAEYSAFADITGLNEDINEINEIGTDPELV
jgi:uncharacterized membrane protein